MVYALIAETTRLSDLITPAAMQNDGKGTGEIVDEIAQASIWLAGRAQFSGWKNFEHINVCNDVPSKSMWPFCSLPSQKNS